MPCYGRRTIPAASASGRLPRSAATSATGNYYKKTPIYFRNLTTCNNLYPGYITVRSKGRLRPPDSDPFEQRFDELQSALIPRDAVIEPGFYGRRLVVRQVPLVGVDQRVPIRVFGFPAKFL